MPQRIFSSDDHGAVLIHVALGVLAALYLWLAGPDSPLRPAQPPADMTRLLEDLRRDSPSLR